jgi:hypothetical protein
MVIPPPALLFFVLKKVSTFCIVTKKGFAVTMQVALAANYAPNGSTILLSNKMVFF